MKVNIPVFECTRYILRSRYVGVQWHHTVGDILPTRRAASYTAVYSGLLAMLLTRLTVRCELDFFGDIGARTLHRRSLPIPHRVFAPIQPALSRFSPIAVENRNFHRQYEITYTSVVSLFCGILSSLGRKSHYRVRTSNILMGAIALFTFLGLRPRMREYLL